MEEKQDHRESFLSTDDFDEVPIAKSSCCSCCCSGGIKVNPKEYFINKWRSLLNKDNTNNNAENPFRILTNLWAHKDVIRDLEQTRLNPDLLNENQIRFDLEFYIPQLCTFMIFGEYEIVEEFLAFLCKACFASFFFAHRVVWFLKSILDEKASYNEKISDILLLLQSIFKSEFDNNVIERFHIASSNEYISYLNQTNNLFVYNLKTNELDLSPTEKKSYEKKHKIREFMSDFSIKYFEYVKQKETRESIDPFFQHLAVTKIPPEEIVLNIYTEQNLEKNITENGANTPIVDFERFKQIDYDDINLISFVSNIHFVDHLCNICEVVKLTPQDKQLEELQNLLVTVNKNLPSNNYLPFTTQSVRNYVIAHIPISEARIFRTKNRAPYCITVEVFRLDELNFAYREKLKASTHSKSSNKERKTSKSKVLIDELSASKKSIKRRSNSFHGLDSQSDKSINCHIDNNDDNIHSKPDNKLGQESMSKKLSKRDMEKKRKQTLLFINESDVKLSQPVKIDQYLPVSRKGNSFDAPEIEVGTEKSKKMDDFIKERRKTIMPLASKKENLVLDKTEKSSVVKEFDKKDTDDIKFKFARSEVDVDIESVSKHRRSSLGTVEKNSRKVSRSMLVEEVNEEEHEVEEIFQKSVENGKVDPYFGELFEDQAERLKKISPFGHLNTWKTFKMIVKSGEDLRQEQFATQLINEFNQIFKLEKVECWVNTYEIISTGGNMGLIECIPNSVSIDQLKRKSKDITSLRNFFEKYFGPQNSERFKNAISNFVKSLAGYSLVCYFLQIKDRHNGNIMIDNEGHIIHIDFGFMLSNAPGKGIKFENAPFKLTNDFVDVMGGVNSSNFSKFRKLVWRGFIAAVKHSSKITTLVEMMFCGHGYNLPCFERGEATIENLKLRFRPRAGMTAPDYMRHVDLLIENSIDNWRTKWYDKFQYYVQGIFY